MVVGRATDFQPHQISGTSIQTSMERQSGLVAWELVKRGFGIAPMSDRIARQTPEVERLLPQMEPIRFPVWLTTHRELHTSRKIRLVFDLLAEHFFQK